MSTTLTSHDHTDTEQPHFLVQRIYAKNISYETTNTPAVFQQEWQPELGLELNMSHTSLETGVYEVVLSVTATVKNQEATAFLAEVQQAGIFTIKGVEKPQLDHMLNSFCPSILFPYAREAITTEVTRGSFPQLILSPINFDALYAQQLEEKQKAQVEHENTNESH